MKLREHEIAAAFILAVILLGVWSWKHGTCTTCQNRFAQMIGAWPGAGPGVAASPITGT